MWCFNGFLSVKALEGNFNKEKAKELVGTFPEYCENFREIS